MKFSNRVLTSWFWEQLRVMSIACIILVVSWTTRANYSKSGVTCLELGFLIDSLMLLTFYILELHLKSLLNNDDKVIFIFLSFHISIVFCYPLSITLHFPYSCFFHPHLSLLFFSLPLYGTCVLHSTCLNSLLCHNGVVSFLLWFVGQYWSTQT